MVFVPPTCPIAGISFRPFTPHEDMRGSFTEVFHASSDSRPIVQWSVVRSNANVLRGVHVHIQHADHILVLEGQLLLGLCDLREESAAYRRGCLIELNAAASAAVEIPPGVAHGFYFPGASVLLHGASEYFD